MSYLKDIMTDNKIVEIEALIQKILIEQSEVSVRSIARAGGYSEDKYGPSRKAIQRALAALVRKGVIKPKGSGRTRVYTKATLIAESSDLVLQDTNSFRDILLSEDSKKLLNYISQPLTSRIPVGYNQDFLRQYQPNKTFYLSEANQKDLLENGQVTIQKQAAGTHARNILNRLLIDLSWNSSRLEGNTYSLLETKRLIEFGESVAGKDLTETQMILNHKAAIEFIVDSANEEQISTHDVYSVHALLSENLLGDLSASGRIRQIEVAISGTTYLPLANPHLLQELLEIFIKKFNEIQNSFEQSLFAFIHISYLQAFEDVNKRTARLVANIPLIKKNLRPLSFVDVSSEAYSKALLAVYEKNDVCLVRDLYLWAYQRSSQRYTAVQKSFAEPNQLQLKYRDFIKEVVRTIILEKTTSSKIVKKIKYLLSHLVSNTEKKDIFNLIELDIANLHTGNIARFKIKPSEYLAWKENENN